MSDIQEDGSALYIFTEHLTSLSIQTSDLSKIKVDLKSAAVSAAAYEEIAAEVCARGNFKDLGVKKRFG